MYELGSTGAKRATLIQLTSEWLNAWRINFILFLLNEDRFAFPTFRATRGYAVGFLSGCLKRIFFYGWKAFFSVPYIWFLAIQGCLNRFLPFIVLSSWMRIDCGPWVKLSFTAIHFGIVSYLLILYRMFNDRIKATMIVPDWSMNIWFISLNIS